MVVEGKRVATGDSLATDNLPVAEYWRGSGGGRFLWRISFHKLFTCNLNGIPFFNKKGG